ncbi:MAG: helix-turn-helix domain-containing protein [Prochloraceae cyanobacterium]|nr:helix-turn-helix domain-containing protein [Prochloraceae cyanobacterium]
MVDYCHLKIKETPFQLQEILNKQKTITSYRKIQALYWLKTEQIKTVQDIANALGVHRGSVQRWFKKYKDEGLESLLTIRKKTGRPSSISSEALSGLQARLHKAEHGFKSYGAIQKWIQSEYGEDINYKTLHGLVRYKLKAKLKVPRKSSIKKDVKRAESFKKN